jgi:hypothetical protein
MLADTVIGLLILAGLVIVAATAAGMQRKAARQMNDLRAATDLAESTLIDLHQGVVPAPPTFGQTVRVEPLNGGAAIPGYSWCRVIASVNGRTVSLLGLRTKQGGG